MDRAGIAAAYAERLRGETTLGKGVLVRRNPHRLQDGFVLDFLDEGYDTVDAGLCMDGYDFDVLATKDLDWIVYFVERDDAYINRSIEQIQNAFGWARISFYAVKDTLCYEIPTVSRLLQREAV